MNEVSGWQNLTHAIQQYIKINLSNALEIAIIESTI